jgi:hypothetical protein
MAENTNSRPSAASLPPEAIALATRMYDAARAGQMDIFQQALPAGLPANMTNEKGDSLVGYDFSYFVQLIHTVQSNHTGIKWGCNL